MRPYLTLMAKMELLLQLRDSVHAWFVVACMSLRLSYGVGDTGVDDPHGHKIRKS